MLSLADVYSVYNRARHTDLISPDDLLAAAQLLQPLHLGMGLHTFPSKLVVIRLDSYSPEAVALRLKDLLRRRLELAGGVTGTLGRAYMSALDLANEWRTPLQIAHHLLLVSLRCIVGQGWNFYLCATVMENATVNFFSLPSQTAESQGAICRDDSISGLRFYANLFCV